MNKFATLTTGLLLQNSAALPRHEFLVGVLALAHLQESLVAGQRRFHLMKFIEHHGTVVKIAAVSAFKLCTLSRAARAWGYCFASTRTLTASFQGATESGLSRAAARNS